MYVTKHIASRVAACPQCAPQFEIGGKAVYESTSLHSWTQQHNTYVEPVDVVSRVAARQGLSRGTCLWDGWEGITLIQVVGHTHTGLCCTTWCGCGSRGRGRGRSRCWCGCGSGRCAAATAAHAGAELRHTPVDAGGRAPRRARSVRVHTASGGGWWHRRWDGNGGRRWHGGGGGAARTCAVAGAVEALATR